MTYYEDLSACRYFGPTDARLVAIGWLDRDHPFPKGQVARPFFESLARLAANAWQPGVPAGRHRCELCLFTGGPIEVHFADSTISVGMTNLFVPANDGVYVAPSLVVHYIDAHGYLPPGEFQRAVEACPPMRSMEYLKAITRHHVNRLLPERARPSSESE